MALCSKCGMIMSDEDAKTHFCKAEDIPEKGKPKKPTTTESVV
jgi:hypothetical protein